MDLSGNHIFFKYGKTQVFEDFSFHLEGPGISIIAGNNGSGKSTLHLLCAGILLPESGQIHLNNLDSDDDFRLFRRNTYWMPEDLENKEMIVHDFLVSDKGPSFDTYEKSFLKKRISTLSRGEKQTLYLNKALDSPANLLLLDEPFLGLDPSEQENAIKKIRKAAKSKLILLTTHSLEIAEHCGDRFYLLSGGKLSEQKSLRNISGFSGYRDERFK